MRILKIKKHVSKEIIGIHSNILKGKKIVVCITASVAAYKAIDLSRMLMRNGAEVYPVMSKSTKSKLLTEEIMNWATGKQNCIRTNIRVGTYCSCQLW